jgi:hypothetical protein
VTAAPTALLDARVLDESGEAHRLGDHLERGLALLVLLRQFGCVGCNLFVTDLAPRLLELHHLGLRSVFVGLGEPAHLAGFIDRMHLADKKLTFFTDPAAAAHSAMALPSTAWSALGPRSMWQRLQAAGQGVLPRRIQGDPFQNGGAALLDGGDVAWFHAGDSPMGLPLAVEIVDRALALAARRIAYAP